MADSPATPATKTLCTEITAGGPCGLVKPCPVHPKTPASRAEEPIEDVYRPRLPKEGYEPGPGTAGSAPAPSYEAVLADVYDEYDCTSSNGAVHRGRRDRFVADAMFRLRPLVESEITAAVEAERTRIATACEAKADSLAPDLAHWGGREHEVDKPQAQGLRWAARIARGADRD